LTLLIVKIAAILGLISSAVLSRKIIQGIKTGEKFKPRLTLAYEGVVAGSLMGAFMSFGIILSNCYNPLATGDPHFLKNQLLVGFIFICMGGMFGSIRGLNKY
jgi:hypothetical protein